MRSSPNKNKQSKFNKKQVATRMANFIPLLGALKTSYETITGKQLWSAIALQGIGRLGHGIASIGHLGGFGGVIYISLSDQDIGHSLPMQITAALLPFCIWGSKVGHAMSIAREIKHTLKHSNETV
ncbi:MAG: hypothetical protein WC004_03110 [Candidatus Absconditabacterales bacterium]